MFAPPSTLLHFYNWESQLSAPGARRRSAADHRVQLTRVGGSVTPQRLSCDGVEAFIDQRDNAIDHRMAEALLARSQLLQSAGALDIRRACSSYAEYLI